MVSGSVTLDLNVAGATTSAIDVQQYLHWVVVPGSATGTFNLATVFWQYSLDGTTWLNFSPPKELNRTSGTDFGTIPYARYIRAVTSSREGSASTLTLNYYGNQAVSDPFEVLVSRGATGYQYLHKFGRDRDVNTGATNIPADINDHISEITYAGYYTSAEQASVLSSNAADTSAGTGARTIILQGLDANWDEQTVTVTMNGATPVVTTETWLRIYRAHVVTAGTDLRNRGDISISGNSSATLMAQIRLGSGIATESGFGQTEMATWTVPRGKGFLLTRFYGSCSRNPNVEGTVALSVREAADVATSPWRIRGNFSIGGSGTSYADQMYDPPLVFPEKTDIRLRVLQNDTANSDYSGGFSGLIYDA